MPHSTLFFIFIITYFARPAHTRGAGIIYLFTLMKSNFTGQAILTIISPFNDMRRNSHVIFRGAPLTFYLY